MVAAQAYPSPHSQPFTGGYQDGKRGRRLDANRFRRIWAIVEEVAANPGHSRRELADRFHLSERQIQADVTTIRHEMRLPLVRRGGYRFVGAQGPGGEARFDLGDAQLVVMILQWARQVRAIPQGRLDRLIAKLPAVFPRHLQPVVQRTLEAVARRSGQQDEVFAAISDALLRGNAVKLDYSSRARPAGLWMGDQIVTPELLLPYLDSWYVLGATGTRNRVVMLPLDQVAAVTLAGPREEQP